MGDGPGPGRGIAAVASVLLGTATSVLVILATSDARWATVSGLVVLVAAWAGVEWFRARHTETEPVDRPHLKVKMRFGSVDGSTVVGAQGTPNADTRIRMKGGDISNKSSVKGYADKAEN